MANIGTFEAKTHLPALLKRVEQGEEITITRRGVPVARLIRAQEAHPGNRREAIKALKEFGRRRSLPAGMTIRDLIEEGRRF
jgi:prevent-host-death family protein